MHLIRLVMLIIAFLLLSKETMGIREKEKKNKKNTSITSGVSM